MPTDEAKDLICAEIQRIMLVYNKQYPNVDTPGGLEHMGDVWSLFLKWDEMLTDAGPEDADA